MGDNPANELDLSWPQLPTTIFIHKNPDHAVGLLVAPLKGGYFNKQTQSVVCQKNKLLNKPTNRIDN